MKKAAINKVAKEIGTKLVSVLGTSALQLVVNYLDAQEIKHYHLHIMVQYLMLMM